MAKNDGGPAFPGYTMQADGETVVVEKLNPGMTLRDWFAGQSLAGFCVLETGLKLHPADAAADAYQLADAMLAARGR